MVALVLADAFLEKFGGDSIDEHRAQLCRPIRRRRSAQPLLASGSGRDSSASSSSAIPSCTTPRRRRRDGRRRTFRSLIDDMIETMYAAPGIGLAAPQVGVPLRIFVVDLSVGRDADGSDRDRQPGVRRARRHAARRGRLPERARVQRHGRPARRAPSSRASTGTATEQTIEGTGLLARAFQHEMDHLDGTLFVDRLRGHQARPDRPQDPEADRAPANGSGTPAACGIVFFGTPAFAVPTLEALLALAPPRRRRRDAAGSAARPRPAASPTRRSRRRRSRSGVPVLQPERLQDPAFLDSLPRLAAPISASSPPTGRSCRRRCSTSRGSA